MKMHMFNLIQGLMLLAVIGLISCGVKPTSESGPGKCALDCSQAVIAGSSNYKIVSSSKSISGTCSAPNQVQATVLWRVVKERIGMNITVPYVSVNPRGLGGAKVVTPDSEWCSDQCGVIEITYSMACPEGDNPAEYSLQVSSGPLFSEYIQVTLEAPTTDPDVGSGGSTGSSSNTTSSNSSSQ